MIEEKRGELVDVVARLGITGAVREGFFDALVTDEEPGSPAISLRISQLQDITSEHSIQIDGINQTTQLFDNKINALQSTTQLQGNVIGTLGSDVGRLESEMDLAEQAHNEFRNGLATVGTDITGLKTANENLTSRVQAGEASDSNKENRIVTLEAIVTGSASGGLNDIKTQLTSKADLEDGKIPLSQLPELPTGRKVTVPNNAAKLTLDVHTDITIAYQQDDGQAYILGAGEDPAIESNWSVLGNTQASGVTAFNGRTGVVTPSSGDYNTAMVTPTEERGYTSSTDRLRWDEKATNDFVTASVSGLRTEVAETYVTGTQDTFLRSDDTTVLKRSELGQASGGIATLGADGKVIAAQLPPQGLTDAQAQRLANVESLAALANQKGDVAADNSVVFDTRISTIEASGTSLTVVNNQVQALRTQQVDTEAAIARIDSVDATQNTRITALEQSVVAPKSPRVWVNQTAARVRGTWYTNTSGNEMELHLWTNNVNDGSYFTFNLRENDASPTMALTCASVNNTNNGPNTRAFGTITVPVGWQYSVFTTHINTRTILGWYELS